MARPDKKTFLRRIDPALWAELKRLAAGELRSVNAQVEYLPRESLLPARDRGGRGKAAAKRKATR